MCFAPAGFTEILSLLRVCLFLFSGLKQVEEGEQEGALWFGVTRAGSRVAAGSTGVVGLVGVCTRFGWV